MNGTDSGLFATGIYGVVKFVGCAIFLAFVADSLGRRRSLLVTSIAQGIVMYIVGIYGRVQPPIEGQPVSLLSFSVQVCEDLTWKQLGHPLWILCYCLHIPLGCVRTLYNPFCKDVQTTDLILLQLVSVWMGARVLDPCCRNPYRPSTCPERITGRRYAVALQLYCCAK